MIYQATKEFPFNNLTLVPSTVLSGNFFTKYLIDEKPLYIQSPKCFSKNGLVKTGKRMFCDLIFLRENEQFIQWIEHLETFTQKYIFDNREKWFETNLEMTDIEDSFTQIMKSYKSGKNYLIRTNVSTKTDGTCSLKIYDENENNVDPESITDKTEIMTILEIQGVKCSSKSFQIEIEIKQMMVLNQIDPFEKCVFKTSTTSASASASASTPPPPVKQVIDEKSSETEKKIFSEPTSNQDKINLYDTHEDIPNELNSNLVNTTEPITNTNENALNNDKSLNHDKEEDELCEVEFDLEELPEEKVQIKNRNDVYYEMYKEAKRKAKIARDLALSSYLEAKRIKNTYMLDDIDDDSDSDDEEDDDEDGDRDEDEDEDDHNLNTNNDNHSKKEEKNINQKE